ncbi:MAG: sigma-70 family RNA polymerase sigma factor [Defluviitoga tunisiensis]|uniref:RNA polymerase sigma factor RpoE n=1 Tax=Defluviitoga tunisiensis TaxID=1006576 RepID=A0A0C7NLN3_DEFTU|nr:sigma-70 family RNA polymerase sigma factor [Defluviitoga tunisiensis]MDD3600224.1 sigma-70 family RNA polymerase sigma factor [Defluviitoga tunisiensis]MDY0379330.1 sigma-70 family RNA polymerase sigma factor [Defluviitoga tunisiensis]CEP78771.1 RNA polymerase sigma factor RpoE [Defluviitoga tunisiensis]HHV01109.1 sigma-70 family RNA polymerase sigma factor [Defluviitoga tunisiensis]HOB54852.1 sigma-70 family RNA polymerase sigma factor [Defluviitoga tunisiensis]
MNDEKFIEALKNKDQKAFKILYDEYAPKIYGILKNYVRPNEIEDALQEVFLRIIRGINNFEGRSKLSTWIYRIAVNVGKNYSRSYSKEVEKPMDLDSDEPENFSVQPISETNVKKEAFNDINYQIILNIMEQLDKDERLLIKLRDIDGLSYNEIAEITDLPLGTVKSKLHYARKKLKKLIEEANLI